MKNMYNESKKHNSLIILACICSVFAVFSTEYYFRAKEELRSEAFISGKPVKEVSYVEFVKNGLTVKGL